MILAFCQTTWLAAGGAVRAVVDATVEVVDGAVVAVASAMVSVKSGLLLQNQRMHRSKDQ